MKKSQWVWIKRAVAAVLAMVVVCGPGSERPARGQAYAEGSSMMAQTEFDTFIHQSPAGHGSILPGRVVVKYKEKPEEPGTKALRSLHADDPGSGKGTPFEKVELGAQQSVAAAVDELQASPEVEYAEPIYLFRLLDTTGELESAGEREAGGVPNLPYVPEPPASSGDTPPYTPGAPSSGGGAASPDKEGPGEEKPAAFPVNDPDVFRQWGLTVTEVTYAWKHVPAPQGGRKVRIAVLDTGVNGDHPDLAGQVLEGFDAVSQTRDSSDHYGHGTKVAGIIAASVNNSIGIAGVAGKVAEILPVRVGYWASREDYVIPSDKLANGIYWAVKNGANIINMSLGIDATTAGTDQIRVVREAISYALEHQVTVVAASGNNSNHWIYGERGDWDKTVNQERQFVWTSFPANMEGVLSVGAVTQFSDGTLALADFSNIGAITLVAPGTEMYTTSAAFKDSRYYEEGNGTSFSAPLVAGIAGLLLAQNPALSPEEVLNIMRDSAKRVPLARPSYASLPAVEALYTGGGLANARRALTLPRLVIEAVPVPSSQGRLSYSLQARAVDDKGMPRKDVSTPLQIAVNNAGSTSVAVRDMVYGELHVPGLAATADEYYELALKVSGSGSSEGIVSSATAVFVKRPPAPISSLKTGTYAGGQRLILTSEVPGAKIYYTINGSSPWPRLSSDSLEYNGPLLVNGNATITAVAVKNEVASLPVSYVFKITQSGGAGGGAGGSILGPLIPVVEEGSELILKPDKNELLSKLAAAGGRPLHIEVRDTGAGKVSGYQVELPGEVWERASSLGTPIVITSELATITIPAHAAPLPSGASTMTLSLQSSKQAWTKLPFATLASPIFELKLLAGKEEISRFALPVTIEFAYDKTMIRDPGRAGVYVFQPANEDWQYAGGKFADSGVSFRLTHASRYAVMEWNRTFEDIQGHWAQAAIERMAARQIADGMTDTTFAPDDTLTRAQCTALLVRSLGLAASQPAEAELPFRDVPKNGWYRDSIAHAYAAGIVSGVSESSFEPEASVSREQMAVMLMNAYARYPSEGEPAAAASGQETLSFIDSGTISAWAQDAVRRAAAGGLLKGNPDGTFAPRDHASRAQVMMILHRLLLP
ncbi:S8 family serine peptidase [Paenibacillus puerhi]|uniref:S8 family serine peptidase n=1 Tax=Paenibacillus puerhi TaxID=2692622 RepID=UPI001359CC84|nr:S8 family serine peptidase [Paenibacillus puerhi]